MEELDWKQYIWQTDLHLASNIYYIPVTVNYGLGNSTQIFTCYALPGLNFGMLKLKFEL